MNILGLFFNMNLNRKFYTSTCHTSVSMKASVPNTFRQIPRPPECWLFVQGDRLSTYGGRLLCGWRTFHPHAFKRDRVKGYTSDQFSSFNLQCLVPLCPRQLLVLPMLMVFWNTKIHVTPCLLPPSQRTAYSLSSQRCLSLAVQVLSSIFTPYPLLVILEQSVYLCVFFFFCLTPQDSFKREVSRHLRS